jgi:hypothetical protein
MAFRGARVVCMRDIFILNEIWMQDKIWAYILIRTLLSLNILLNLLLRTGKGSELHASHFVAGWSLKSMLFLS